MSCYFYIYKCSTICSRWYRSKINKQGTQRDNFTITTYDLGITALINYKLITESHNNDDTIMMTDLVPTNCDDFSAS